MKHYVVHWLDGKIEELEGRNIADAFRTAGYSAGALGAVDYWEEVELVKN